MKTTLLSLLILSTACYGQAIITTNRNDNATITLTNTAGYVTVLPTTATGIVPVSITFQNFGAGVAEVRHTDTNGIGYVIQPGQSMSFGYWTQVLRSWFGRTIGSTNTVIRIIRESK